MFTLGSGVRLLKRDLSGYQLAKCNDGKPAAYYHDQVLKERPHICHPFIIHTLCGTAFCCNLEWLIFSIMVKSNKVMLSGTRWPSVMMVHLLLTGMYLTLILHMVLSLFITRIGYLV